MKKTKRENKKYSPKFKIHVIMDMRENHLGYHEATRKYFPHLEQRNTFLIFPEDRQERICNCS